MTSFPLYDSLNTKLQTKDLTLDQKKALCKNISELDQTGKELVYALIKYHEITSTKKNNNEPPYEGQCVKSDKKGCEDITWNISEFPVKLRLILYKFINLHKKKIHEEKEIQEIKEKLTQ